MHVLVLSCRIVGIVHLLLSTLPSLPSSLPHHLSLAQVIAVARTADLILMMLDSAKAEEQR